MTDKQTQTATDEQKITLLELLQVVVKRKMLVVKVCSVAIIAAVAYSLTLPNIYSATAKVLPPQKENGGGLSALLGQAGGVAGLAAGGLGTSCDLYLGLLRSRSVEDAVVQRLNLVRVYKAKTAEIARQRLDHSIKSHAGKDGIISISADNGDPRLAAQIANTLVDELGRITVRLNLSKAGTERSFLERRLELVKKDLKAAEDDLKSFSLRHKVVQVDSQAKASIEGIARMKAELASKEVQLSVLRSQQTEESPGVASLKAGIGQLKAEMGRLAGSEGGGDGIPAVGNVPNIGLEYSRKMRELKTQEAIYEQLMKQYEMAKLSESKDTTSLQIVDEAVVPVNKSRPSRSTFVLLSAFLSFFASLLLVFLCEYYERMSEQDKRMYRALIGMRFAAKEPR